MARGPSSVPCQSRADGRAEGRRPGCRREAQVVYQRALAIGEKTQGKDNPHTAVAMMNLGELAVTRGKYEDAEPWCQRVFPIFEHAYGPSHVFIASALSCIGSARLGLHAPRQALPVLERSVAMWKAHPGRDPSALAADFALARALGDVGRSYSRARVGDGSSQGLRRARQQGRAGSPRNRRLAGEPPRVTQARSVVGYGYFGSYQIADVSMRPEPSRAPKT
jgi:hypothetical protein